MAQYLREPLFVFDVDADNNAHAQRYYFKDYTMDNGTVHETGCGGAIDDEQAKRLLGQYARLHVLPVMMVIKRHEGHFYGVHHGEISTRWLAEGDRQFLDANCTTHTWYVDVVAHMDYSATRMPSMDPLEDSPEADMVIIGVMEHRDRLDLVHDRLGLPRLDGAAFDIAHMEATLSAEGERLQAEAGAQPSQDEAAMESGRKRHLDSAGRRYPIDSHGKAALAPIQRILDSIGMEPELLPDRNKLRLLLQVNKDAWAEWWRATKQSKRGITSQDGHGGLMGLMPWLLKNRAELHSVFRYLPYPELAAKQLSPKVLQHWGELEAYDEMVATIRDALQDPKSSQDVVSHCRTWLAACTLNDGDSQDRIVAGERHRWARLRQMRPGTPCSTKPERISTECWNVLHVLPYTTWAWGATTMGQALRGQVGQYYSGQPAIQQLCERVATCAEWGAAVVLPSGLTWDDRLPSMEAGLPAQTQY